MLTDELMGPKKLEPPLSGFEWTSPTKDQVHVSDWLRRSDYSVGKEGESKQRRREHLMATGLAIVSARNKL